MPRAIPRYVWPITEGKPLKNEPTRHRTTYKSGVKKLKTSREPIAFPKTAQGQGNVQFGSHSDVAKQISEEMKRLGL